MAEAARDHVDMIPARVGILDGDEEAMANSEEEASPFAHLVPAWAALTPEQRRPTTGTSIPAGGPLETLDEEGLETLRQDSELFDEARRSASAQLGRIAVG